VSGSNGRAVGEHQHQGRAYGHRAYGRADDGDNDGDDDFDDVDAEPLCVAPRALSDAIVGWFKSVSCGNEKLQVKKSFFTNQNTVLPHDSASEKDHPPHRLRLTVSFDAQADVAAKTSRVAELEESLAAVTSARGGLVVVVVSATEQQPGGEAALKEGTTHTFRPPSPPPLPTAASSTTTSTAAMQRPGRARPGSSRPRTCTSRRWNRWRTS
jgi:hypothetical protein